MSKPIDKIRKLLALTDSPNEHEARTAMIRAQELMLKHKLSLRDVQTTTDPNTPFGIHRTSTTFKSRGTKWKAALSSVIADNFLCEAMASTDPDTNISRICFIGSEDDLEICITVFNYAVGIIQHESRAIRRDYYKHGESAKGLEASYAFGFIRGLAENYEEQKRKHQEYALVLVKDPRIQEVMDQMTKGNPIPIKSNVNNMAAATAGYWEGRMFSHADRIGSGEESTAEE